MVAFDATILSLAFTKNANAPQDPSTGNPVEKCRERIDFLISKLDSSGEKVVIPTPALSEFLVHAGDKVGDYLAAIESNSVFRVVGFDMRAAVEVAAIIRKAKDAGHKGGGSNSPWQTIKFDL